jgi:xanthine dehydrogenase YagS FAD-binding subunit
MRPFEIRSVADEHAAVAAAGAVRGARFLAGGTTLVDLMKLDVERPAHLIDVGGLRSTRVDELPNGGLRIGALVRNSDLAHHPLLAGRYPLVAQALLAGASPQIRNMATTGGNLLQRTRCPYFRDTATRCNKRRPGSGCDALEGDHRTHAVLGVSPRCIATHPSDFCVALAALDVTVRVLGPRGERTLPFSDLHLLPGDTPEREHALAEGELITAVDVAPLAYARRSLYLKVRDRASFAFALASAAVALDVAAGVVREARVALGGVGTKPWRSREAETALRGSPAAAESFERAATAALAAATPRPRNTFKVELARRTLVRALTRAAALPESAA